MSMPMPVITLSSAAKTIISHPSEFNTYKFSSHVDETEETFVLKLANAQSLTPSISIPHDHRLIFPGKDQTKDSEIGVFDAEKYFSEGLNVNSSQSPKLVRKTLPPHQPNKRHEPLEIFEIKGKSRTATPSVVSESSSNNSRSVLLSRDVPRTSKPKKTIKKSFLAVIGCNNPLCCDRSSVDTSDEPSKKISNTVSADSILVKGIPRSQLQVDYKGLERRSSDSDFSCQKFDEQHAGLRVNSNDHFSFPIFSTGDNQTKETAMPKQRSLQVFGSPIAENGNKCQSPEKIDPASLTWDAIPKASEEIKITSNELLQNDGDSDASSDLFEIESFSKNNPFLSRQASDNGTTCYAPSEASIEWSVVTASGPEELKSNPISKGLNSRIDEISIKRRSGILSGCKSQKAVRIVEDVHKVINNYNEKGFSDVTRRFHGAESYAQMTTRLYDEAGFVARNRQRSCCDA